MPVVLGSAENRTVRLPIPDVPEVTFNQFESLETVQEQPAGRVRFTLPESPLPDTESLVLSSVPAHGDLDGSEKDQPGGNSIVMGSETQTLLSSFSVALAAAAASTSSSN